MDTMITIAWQVVTMFLLAAVGYWMYRSGKISGEGSKTLGNILIYLSLPCVIIDSFLVERTGVRMTGLLVSALASAAVLALSMGISRLMLGRHAIDNFAASFSNPGFFGVPLIAASFEPGAVFYIAPFIAILNLLQWTYGVSLLKKSDEKGLLPPERQRDAACGEGTGRAMAELLRRLVKAPFMIAILIGLFFFLTALPMPEAVDRCIGYIAGVNTPLAMFTIGIYMAQTDVRKLFTKPQLYRVALVRMVAIPLASMMLLSLLPYSMRIVKFTVLIAAACPVGSNVAVYAQLHNKDFGYAVETVVISTLLSLLTMPLLVGAAGYIW